MRHFLFLISFLFSLDVLSGTIKVAVLDTGFDMDNPRYVKLCKDGHKDFTNTSLSDKNGHGSNIAGLIAKNNKKTDYCLIILKIFGGKKSTIYTSTAALKYAYDINVDIVNLSYGGKGYNVFEGRAIHNLLDKGVRVIAAAGNENTDLNKNCNYYPACYDKRIEVVGNFHKKSNYGDKHVDIVIDGNNKRAMGYTLTGTSQSAAIRTGDLLLNMNNRRNSFTDSQAASKIMEAVYVEANLEEALKRLEDKLPEEVKEYGGLLSITQIISQRRIQHQWSF